MDAVTVTTELNWGNFQSIVQLSAALNAAFYALIDLLQKDVPLEKRRLRVVIGRMEHAKKRNKNFDSEITDARLLIGSLERIDRQYAWVAGSVFRPMCIMGFLLAVFLLFRSSYHYSDPISSPELFFVSVSILPFLLAIVYAVGVWGYIRIAVTLKRKKFESGYKVGIV